MRALSLAIGILPGVVKAGFDIYDHVKEKEEKKKLKERKKMINNDLLNQIKELNEERNRARENLKLYEDKIETLQQLINNNEEFIDRQIYEEEQEKIIKEQEEEEKRIKQIEKETAAIEKCRQSLSDEFIDNICEIENNFSKEEEKWINSLYEPKIEEKINKLKNELVNLFEQLFELENIIGKINNKFLKTINDSIIDFELEKMNFIVIGNSGVGKSTLINESFGEYLAKEGMGTRITLETKKYESKLVPFLTILDTMGTEIGSGNKLIDVLEQTLENISKQLDSKNPNDHIHCIIYCCTSNRFFKDELEVILKLREKYDGKKLPIVIVYTKAVDDNEVEGIKNTINEFLKAHNECLSDDIFGITFTKILAREEIEEKYGQKRIEPRFGLANLMSICFKKGEKSYKYALKTALIQIGKNSIKDYLDNIHAKLINNINYFNYIYHQFDPNFADYIAYCFDKLTDIDEQKGISEEDLNKLQNYLNNHQIEGQKDLSEVKCMECGQPPKDPFRCINCESEFCGSCYLNKFDDYISVVQCKNCYESEFEKVFSEETKDNFYTINYKNKLDQNYEEYEHPKNKINEEELDDLEKKYDSGKEDTNNKINNYNEEDENNNEVLTNNLNIGTIEAINLFIEKFRSELLDILNEKFNNFAEKSAEDIYEKILEKFCDNVQDNDDEDINLIEGFQGKKELKEKAIVELNFKLKEGAQKKFLAQVASHFFQDIIQKFRENCLKKLDDYIKNLLNNEKVQEIFKDCEKLVDKKELKFGRELKEYINNLQEKEKKSKIEALRQLKLNRGEIDGSGSSCSTPRYA